ncbi:MAG: hypothetical protein NW220_07540 [Leptolyngbyaceae cyanobacterium bins.349]|nr:hypothetical protein [Leptolyngbyaceae cyanobacterium bins.349]
MTLNSLKKSLLVLGHHVLTTVLGLLVVVGIWQGLPLANTTAMAGPAGDVITAEDLRNSISEQTSDLAEGSKNFIDAAKEKVKSMADDNASRVDDADDKGGFFERKAKKDRDRIMKRAEEDAARTKQAVDDNLSKIQP